ncbi:hypothetical protein KP509_23G077500 [Ceratopteris richardii]|uniref:Uncharacterized protein n=1 Tax=Ceratopteris richardii TaxID=49495 RepID=A0A8T2S1B2_CERRI|nr:hypothetical protein KP509_23G077500 [Ceratopteris richardii]
MSFLVTSERRKMPSFLKSPQPKPSVGGSSLHRNGERNRSSMHHPTDGRAYKMVSTTVTISCDMVKLIAPRLASSFSMRSHRLSKALRSSSYNGSNNDFSSIAAEVDQRRKGPRRCGRAAAAGHRDPGIGVELFRMNSPAYPGAIADCIRFIKASNDR